MIKYMKKGMKKIDIWDVALIKWSTLAFTLFLITVWPAFSNLVFSINTWYFFVAFILLMIRPCYRMYFKK